jgi:hypothetical protein
VLYYAIHYGTLSGLLQWDDCIIVLRGFENLDRLMQPRSVGALLHALLHLDIHAPLTDAQTMLGLLLSGGQIWGPFLLNAVWLALLLGCLLRSYGPDRRLLAASAVVLVIVQALTINALDDLKSDWDGGLLIAGAFFLLARGAQTRERDLTLIGSGLLGLAVLSKLTAFYLPVVAAVALLLFEVHAALLRQRRPTDGEAERGALAQSAGSLWQSMDRRALALRLLIAVGPFVLFFLYSLRPTLYYIRSATGAVWDDGRTPLGRLRFYGPFGPDAWMEWGNLHGFFLVFAGAALLMAWRRRDAAYPRALLILAAIAALLLAPLLVASSNHSFGATLLGVVLAATLLSLDYAGRALGRRAGPLLLVLTILIALPAGLPLKNSNYYTQFPVDNAELRALAGTYAQIVDSMRAHARQPTPRVVVFYDHVFAPHPNLAIKYFQQTGRLPAIDRVDDLTGERWQRQLQQADFALTLVPGTRETGPVTDLYPAYPISRDPGRADELVRQAGTFEAIGVFAVRGAEIRLYARR